jgi:hypothetical protein
VESGGYLVLLGALLVCLALAYAVRLRLGRLRAGFADGIGGGARRVCGAVGILAGYVLLMDRLGYVLSTAAFLVAFLRLFGSYAWLWILVASLGLAVVLAHSWALLGLMLPGGILGWP